MEGTLYALGAVFVISAVMISVAVWVDKLTLFAPRRSRKAHAASALIDSGASPRSKFR